MECWGSSLDIWIYKGPQYVSLSQPQNLALLFIDICTTHYFSILAYVLYLSMILILPIQVCVNESSLQKQSNGTWNFEVVVCTRAGKHLYILLLHYAPPLYNIMSLQFQKKPFVVPAIQAVSLFYLSISCTQCSIELNKARFLPPSRASCTNLLLLGLHSTNHKTTRDPLKKSIGVTLCEDQSSKKLVARFEMLQWPFDGWWERPQEWSHDASVMTCMYLIAIK